MVQLSVVIPCRDEARNIGPLVQELRAALRGRYDYELVFVDDGSRDDTIPALRRARSGLSSEEDLRLLRHPEPLGQSTALWTGVLAARGTLIATLDGDGQNDPADLPRMLAAFTSSDRDPRLGLAIGHRVRRDDPWIRRIASRIANVVRARALGDGTPDTGCGIKVFPRSLFLQLPYFDHMHRFLPALIVRQGGTVISIPVAHRARKRGTSKYGVWDRLRVGLVDLAGVAWLKIRERRPRSVEEIDLESA